ncbi:transmembrane protein 201-like [Littorina saxatilis]|uniref:Ima1 N-terminal domain-containing protein n=1 Tax=Littorina saxatilis TaxID=31220 RepID=A0AAN9AXA4_9CAEN
MEFLLGFLFILCVAVACLIAYRNLRPLFPVKVNCWFCNHDTEVPFGNRNCWDCPDCEQYNGFSTDGDYNKPVPAQFTEDINHPINCRAGEFLTRCQYLCHNCQRNQLLKIKQLAAFVPLNEATYDDEIAFYKRHLENVYALCLSCDAVIKRELMRIDHTLERQRNLSDIKDSPPSTNYLAESEVTVPMYKTVNVNQAMLVSSTAATIFCAVTFMACCLSCYAPRLFPLELAEHFTSLVDELSICLCGLMVCILSKLMLGKGRLYVGDAVDILLWLAAMLVSFYTDVKTPQHVVTTVTLYLAVTLVCLEVGLAMKHRHPTNTTSTVIRRLSLDGCIPGANSDAVSEAVSSVSTSCRRQRNSPFSDGGDGPSTPQLSTASSGKETMRFANGDAGGLFGNDLDMTLRKRDRREQKGDLDGVQKDLGSFLIGPRTSESGYSTGRSSPFSQNSFGPVTGEPNLSSGILFPRPLISPPRLSVVSFSPSSVTGTSTFARSPQSVSPSLFSLSQLPHGAQQGSHYNIFLAQEPRPRSLFTSLDTKELGLDSSAKLYPQYQTLKSSLLFSSLVDQKTSDHKTSSEAEFPRHGVQGSSVTPKTWWRDTASEIINTRDNKTPERSVFLKEARNQPVSSEEKLSDVFPECDSTTPTLSKLSIDSPVKKKKKKKSATKSWAKKQQEGNGVLDNFYFSDDDDDVVDGNDMEERETFPANLSSASTMLLQPKKKDWSVVEKAAIVVVIISVATNLLLAWAVWTSR